MPPVTKTKALSKATKTAQLDVARTQHKAITTARSKRDAAIARARNNGASWREITETVGCALRTAQMAVERNEVTR